MSVKGNWYLLRVHKLPSLKCVDLHKHLVAFSASTWHSAFTVAHWPRTPAVQTLSSAISAM
jgi:hypothetical protein